MIRLSNDVFGIQHPLVDDLLASKITPEEFAEKIGSEDPFLKVVHDKDVEVTGYNGDQVKQNREARNKQAVVSVRTFAGIPLDLIYELREELGKLYPVLLPGIEKLGKKIEEGCIKCQRDKLSRDVIVVLMEQVRQQWKAQEQPVKLLELFAGKISDVGAKILRNEPVTDEEILAVAPPSPFMKMKEYSARPREVFFDSPACGRGTDEDVCKRCRSDRDFRVQLNRDYQIPMFYTVKDGEKELVLQTSTKPTLSEDFDCPFAETVDKKFPSIFKQLKNGFGALSRIVSASMQGKHIRANPQVISARNVACSKCPKLERDWGRCMECGCFIAAKIALITEDCPLGKWDPQESQATPALPIPPIPAEFTKVGADKKPPLEFPTISISKQEILLLQNTQSIGDIVMMTAAVRDLARAYPGRFRIGVDTSCKEIWEHNEYVDHTVTRQTPDVRVLQIGYSWIMKNCNTQPYHFVHGFGIELADKLGLPHWPVTEFKGHVPLSSTEKTWMSMIHQHYTHADTPYWLIVSGGKSDYTTKHWIPEYAQDVVDHFKDRIQFVQIGSRTADNGTHRHPALKGVINLLDKTDLRMLIRLMYSAQGLVTPITAAMHLAAAVETRPQDVITRACVTICGGREPHQFIDYPNHVTLHTNGMLPCCDRGGCWKSRTVPVGDKDYKDNPDQLCIRTIDFNNRKVQQCMAMITPDLVIAAIERYLQHPKRPTLDKMGLKSLEA